MAGAAEDDVTDLGHVVAVALEAGGEVVKQGEGLTEEAGIYREAPGHHGEDGNLPEGDDQVDEVS